MRVVPERSPWLQIASVFGGFLLGPFSALQLSILLVPDSNIVQTASVFGFVLVFAAGTVIWMGLGVTVVVLRRVRSLIRGKTLRPRPAEASGRMVPPGYRSYVVLGVLAGIAIGIVAGLVTHLSVPMALGLWGVLGTAYGVALWLAAHHGYLPFGDPE